MDFKPEVTNTSGGSKGRIHCPSFSCSCGQNFGSNGLARIATPTPTPGGNWKTASNVLLPSSTKLRRLCFYRCVSVHGGGWYPSMHCRWYPSMPCNRSLEGGACSGGRGVWRPPPKKQMATCCGWYASYWNAFLLIKTFIVIARMYKKKGFDQINKTFLMYICF